MQSSNHLASVFFVIPALLHAASVMAASREISLRSPATSIQRYQRIEFEISAPTDYENPYDPNEIDIHLELATPGKKQVQMPAFFYVPFEYQPPAKGSDREWLYPSGAGTWKARFAPAEVGTYSCVAVLKDRLGVVRSDAIHFDCTDSKSHGFVHVSTKNPRYLEFDDGTPFFAIGQDVAFIKNSELAGQMIRRLGESGGNFARVWACCEDWALAIEARKSAWGRSWAWNPPIVLMPGEEGFQLGRLCLKLGPDIGSTITCSPSRPVALKPNKRYRLSGRIMGERGIVISFDIDGEHQISPTGAIRWTEFHEDFTSLANEHWLADIKFQTQGKGRAFLRDLSLKEPGGGPELLWEADVNRPLLGVYNQPDCFLLDRIIDRAEESGIYLQLVMLTRNQYMPFLANENSAEYARAITKAKQLARYFVARWGYSTHVAAWEYFNEINPKLPTDRFYSEVGHYLEQIDPYRHLRATSAWSAPDEHWHNSKLDTADLHYYLRPANGEIWKDAAAAVAAQAKLMDQHAPGKPHLFSEFGITDNAWNRSPMIDADKQFLHLHDGLWASMMSGFASTVCHWYWDDIERKDMYHHYGPISRFAADITWTGANLRPASARAGRSLRVMGLQSADHAYLWISDPTATWWAVANEKLKPAPIENASISIDGLTPGKYRTEWWDTYTGKVIDSRSLEVRATSVEAAIPAFTRDIACKITSPVSSR